MKHQKDFASIERVVGYRLSIYSLAVIVLLSSCSQSKKSSETMPSYQQTWDFTNANGMSMSVTNYGGRIIKLMIPTKNGMVDVVLGYDSLNDYTKDQSYIGALIGRYGNRIAKGKFTMDGKEYTLAKNNGENSLHGGPGGFHHVYWMGEPFQNNGNDALQLEYTSVDGEEGFPGNLKAKVVYTLTDNNELIVEYEATTDQQTVINLTQHSYFNLNGAGNGDILGHRLEIFADKFTPVNASLIPTGELKSVTGTAFDFTMPHLVGERINNEEGQLKMGKGYDHNFVLNKPKPDSLTIAARVVEPNSGLTMEVYTTEPGIQFYSGNFLDGSVKGKGGVPMTYRSGFCLETQRFPDSPNQPAFPSTMLKPGQVYKTRTIYKFIAQ